MNPTIDLQDVRYEPDERPPLPITVGLGIQYAILCVASVVLTPTVMITVAGAGDAYLSWAVFAALVISGVTTAIQARKVGRIGAGYILVMGSTSAFLAVSVTALEQGGPAMLATLIIASSLVQFVLATRMALLRRFFTPAVAGTVLMLIPVTLAPVILRKLADVPEDVSPAAGPVIAGVTLLVMILVPLRFSGALRLWAPAIGIVAGCLTADLGFGLYDTSTVAEAAWVGLPVLAYPGVDLSFQPEFWALLPSFIMVTLVGALDTLGDAIAIQRVSWRRPRAIDFRSIQGALSADGLGNLLSGLSGTVPNTTYGMSISVAELTGIAARRIGVCVGIVFVALAFLPKFIGLIVAIPGPVAAAYFIVIVALIFVFGMKILVQEGLDFRKGLVVGVAFWIGLAFQFDWIYPEYLEGVWADLLGNGMTVGGFTVILLAMLEEAIGGRRSRLKTRLTPEIWSEVDDFMVKFVARKGLGKEMERRLRAVGEETAHVLMRGDEGTAGPERRLLVIAGSRGGVADLEFIATTDETNIEDQLAMLSEKAPNFGEETPLRLLRHYATSIRHQQYHDIDILSVRVESAAQPMAGIN